MPACKTIEAETERRRKISDATIGVSKGLRKPWSAEARIKHSNVIQLRWDNTTDDRRSEIGSKISAARLGSLIIEDPNLKRCRKCKQVLLKGFFLKDSRNKDGLFGTCKSCQSEKAKEWAENHPAQTINFRRNHYNINFNALWEQQKGMCALCGEPMLPKGKGANSVVIDHDHQCCPPRPGRAGSSCGKCVRGLLHRQCNLLLGLIEKNQSKLDLAVKYLDRWKVS